MKLNVMFTDHMVFQADKAIRVFGEGNGTVRVSFAGNTAETKAENGGFLCMLPAMKYGGPYTLTVSDDTDTVTLHDIYVGEVILCAGQSNMQFTVSEGKIPEERQIADNGLRMFRVERPEQNAASVPSMEWVCSAPENIPEWSALGWMLGREAREAGIPYVGIVVCAQGASNIQTWMDETEFLGTALDFPDEMLHIDAFQEQYFWNKPGLLYHTMFETLCPFGFGNVVWYQGESNTGKEGEFYAELLSMMVSQWRRRDRDPGLPFTVVQIADFLYPWNAGGWKMVQKAQLDAQDMIPGLHTVLCADFSEPELIHPLNKAPLAARLFASMREHGTI